MLKYCLMQNRSPGWYAGFSVAAGDIPDELQKKIAKWEANKPEYRSLRTLEDMAAMMEEVVALLDSQRESGKLSSKEIGAVLVDMRESLGAIKTRKDPEMPDHSKPLLAGLQKLEKAFVAAIDSIDMKPEFKPNISVNAPEVNVAAPNIDFSKVERVLKVDIPKAFKEAINAIPVTEIPETDLAPLLERLDNMSNQLASIDTASRMKPQFPGSIGVKDLDQVISNSARPASIFHGVTTVTIAGTDVALAVSTPCVKIDIQAQTDNTGFIAVGGQGVDATEATGTGIELEAGDVYSLEIDNLADIYIDATVSGEGVRYTYYTT